MIVFVLEVISFINRCTLGYIRPKIKFKAKKCLAFYKVIDGKEAKNR